MAEAESEAEAEDQEEETTQWLTGCDDCDNPADHYCTTCGDKLCPGCKDNHLSRKKKRDHQVVPYITGMSAANKSESTCSKHPGEHYALYCRPCKLPVCAFCVAQFHFDENHTFLSIPDAFAIAKDKATSNLQKMTKYIRPKVTEYSDKLQYMATESLEAAERIGVEMKITAKRLHEYVDQTLEESLKQLSEMKERSVLPKIQKGKKTKDEVSDKVEKVIKDYEDNLRSGDPIDLLTFMRDQDKEELNTAFPTPTIEALPMIQYCPASLSKETIQKQFGSLSLSHRNIVEPARAIEKENVVKETVTKEYDVQQGQDQKTDKTLSLSIIKVPDRKTEFSLDVSFGGLAKLRHLHADKMWISSLNHKIVLVNRVGTILHVVDIGCNIVAASEMNVSHDKELIFVDKDKGQVRKISQTYQVTTLFTIKSTKMKCLVLGIHQLQSGDWVVCMRDEGVLRVYDGAGKVIREIGQGHLKKPYYVTVNKVNDDICVSDNGNQVVVFSSSSEKRFTYTGHGNTRTGFNRGDLCCDQLGNILITDYRSQSVHILDGDSHFLQYLVSGKEDIYYPITIDVDDRGYAWVGERYTRKVKAYKYLS